ncbi:MAG TPA: nuclear transport factor 2 family protein [Acidimicrobiia bacterium]
MSAYTPRERGLIEVWEAHTAAEFELRSADAALAVMTDDPTLIHVPVGTGASGRDALRAFYADVFIPHVPADMGLELLTRTVSVEQGRLVDEFIVHLTHTVQMDWFVPGLAPTGRTVTAPHVAVIAFEDGKISSEHIYWDQGTVLRQLGVLGSDVPVLGNDAPTRLRNPNAPANELIARTRRTR